MDFWFHGGYPYNERLLYSNGGMLNTMDDILGGKVDLLMSSHGQNISSY